MISRVAAGVGDRAERRVARGASHVESRASRASASGSRAASKSWPARPQSAAAALGAVGRQALLEKQRLNQERVMQRLREKQAADAARQDREYAERQARIRSGEAGIVSDVGTFLSLKAEDAQRKKEKLHAEWTEEIFAPIQAQIDREVVRRARTAEGLGARWRAVQDQYLETSERKEFGLFRDIIIESEYDPLVNHARSVRYRRAHLKDPVKLELNKFEEERRAIPGETYAKQQLCKETLTPLLWDKLDATPYGRFSKMIAREQRRAVRREVGAPRVEDPDGPLRLPDRPRRHRPRVPQAEAHLPQRREEVAECT